MPTTGCSHDLPLATTSAVLQVLILSYEAFRIHAERFTVPGACDLLICDEAHRLKNDATLTSRALGGLACRRRVLLSGTPMQNHLDEVRGLRYTPRWDARACFHQRVSGPAAYACQLHSIW